MRRAVTLLFLLLPLAGAATPAAPAHPCVRGNELWFDTADGVKLVGHRFGGVRPGTKTTVVLAHQAEADLCQWVPYARKLAAQGYFVFPFDFRGHGFSKGFIRGPRLPGDVAAAVRAVRGLGAKTVVVVGASMGGIASLVAAANIRPPLAGVVSLSAPQAYIGMDALKTAPRLTVPVLYAAGRDEPAGRYDFPGAARAMFAATASSDKKVEIFSSDAHGIALLQSAPSLQSLLADFLRAR